MRCIANPLLAVALFAAALLPFSAAAQRADCDFDYVIQPDDTLPEIAETAFGRRTYTLIYARNFGVIVNIAQLPVGDTIVIPCLPGDASQTPNAAALTARMAGAPAPEPTPQEQPNEDDVIAFQPAQTAFEQPAPDIRRVRILTASGNAPYADEKLRNGGMATELTARALNRLIDKDAYEVIFVNDQSKHLQELILKGSFDVGFPWTKPQCENLAALSSINPEGAWMCENFEFSEAFYEVVSGFFVRRDSVSLRSGFEDFATATICRPSNEPIDDLEIAGISEEFADIFRPKTAADCLRLLASGFADAAIGDVFEIENAMFDLGLEDQIEELPELSLLTSVHAVAPKSKRSSLEALDTLNQGMLELKLSGEWYRVVARHLAQN